MEIVSQHLHLANEISIILRFYTKFSRYVEEQYPDLQEEMFFRLSYAYFFIFDKLLHVEGYQKLEEYKVVRELFKTKCNKNC